MIKITALLNSAVLAQFSADALLTSESDLQPMNLDIDDLENVDLINLQEIDQT